MRITGRSVSCARTAWSRAGPALGGDGAAVLLQDAVADAEAEAGALVLRLGGEERIEDPLHQLRRDAAAVVAHAADHRRRVGPAGDARLDADGEHHVGGE